MKKPLFALGIFFAFALPASQSLPAQSTPALPQVNESSATAILKQNAIEIQLPLTTPALSPLRVSLRLISPSDKISAQQTLALPAGARSATLLIPWPKDAHGQPDDDIGWYRISYSLDSGAPQQTTGILSLGLIARNLLNLRVARPPMLDSGHPLSLRVHACNPITNQPIRGVHLEARLSFDSTPSSKTKSANKEILRTAISDRTGEALFDFPVPSAPGQQATITVKGTLAGIAGTTDHDAFSTATVSVDLDTNNNTEIQLETDKPLHKPGEVVHLRALAFDNSRHALANTALMLTISDPESKKILELPLTTNKFGIASYDWKTTPQLVTGEYEAEIEFGDSSDYEGRASRTLIIQRYDLPEFTVSAQLDHSYYLEGQSPLVHLHAGYLFGKPVAAGQVRIVRASESHWDKRTGKMETPENVEQKSTLDPDGNADLHLDIKSDFDDFKDQDYERYQDLQYRAIVTDASTGRSEPRNFTVRLTREPIHIYIVRQGGNDREGDYIITANYADGKPAALKIALNWMNGDSLIAQGSLATTNRYGLAKLHLQYPALQPGQDSFSLRLTAQDKEGRYSKQDESIDPATPETIWLSLAHTILKPTQPIEAIVHAQQGTDLDVDLLADSGPLLHTHLHMTHSAEPLVIPSTPHFTGVLTLRVYSMKKSQSGYDYSWDGLMAFKNLLYPENRSINLKLNGLRSSYLPGADVTANLDLTDSKGQPLHGVLGLSVIDTAVEQRAQTELEANERWYGWNWWQNSDSVSGISLEMLNAIDTSQPISSDLELVAEYSLQSTYRTVMRIDENYSSSPRDTYEKNMADGLKSVGLAILNARPPKLPVTLDAITKFTRDAKLNEALLLDPWNTPYKPELSIVGNNAQLTLISAGPDKRFNTADDFSINLLTRNLFALEGEQLTNLLKQTVASSKPLPATVDELKRLALTNGLNLDTLTAPNGKPYSYAIHVKSRFYTVEVSRQQEGRLWTTPAIDFFSVDEARLNAAINAWTAAGNPFPGTEAEARQAFAAANIDFDSLRDPLGKPYHLRSAQLLSYTRVDQVKAAGSLEVKTKPVTQLMRAIQILRTLAPQSANDASLNDDLVAQFLHPISEQSGSDLTPHPIDQGTFKANTGAIGGTITDQSGAVIQNATITVKNSDSSFVVTIHSLPNGTYIVPDLEHGYYTIEVNAIAFRSFVLHDVPVNTSTLTTVDVELKVGSSMQTVEVSAEASLLSTTASVSHEITINEAQISSMPSKITTPNGSATVSLPTFTPRLRHVFDETAYWQPSLETSSQGFASVHFHLPDSLTTWKLHALASTIDGRITAIDQLFKTFQPFFVALDAPQILTLGDELTLPVNLRNYTAHSLALPVTVKPADWLELTTPATLQATVAANQSTAVDFGLRARSTIEAGLLRITAANSSTGDAVEKTIQVHPDGEPRTIATSGILRDGSTKLAIDLPSNITAGSLHAQLILYPNLGVKILHSMKAVLQRPHGCGEQTISSAYPSLLFLKLLKDGKLSSPLQSEAQNYLQLGYDQLIDFFDPSGGLTYWGGNDHTPDPALTAYGIEFLTEAEPFINVDSARISAAQNWLLLNQQPDGSWKPHYGQPNAALNLFIAEALQQTLAKDATKLQQQRVQQAVTRALDWVSHSVTAVHDPYSNALRLRLAIQTSDAAAIANLRAELIATARHDRDGIYWSNSTYTPFYGWGHAGALETTGLVVDALAHLEMTSEEKSLTNSALLYLLQNQDRYGIWYSSQATVRVLQALTPIAIAEMQQPATASHAQQLQLSINNIPLSNNDAATLQSDPKLLDAPRTLDLTTFLAPGQNELSFTTSDAHFFASVDTVATYYIPWADSAPPAQTKTQTGKDFGLDFGYHCAADNAKIGQPIQCKVDLRRFGSNSYGMLIAEVGLPPGADVDRPSLSRLLDSWTISRYELQPDRIIFYLWSSLAAGEHFTFNFTPRYAIHAKAAPATLSDYYNPDLTVTLAPQTFHIVKSD